MALVSESHTPSVISNMYQYILYSIMGANSKHIDDEYGIGDRNLYRTHPESGCAYKKITRWYEGQICWWGIMLNRGNVEKLLNVHVQINAFERANCIYLMCLIII